MKSVLVCSEQKGSTFLGVTASEFASDGQLLRRKLDFSRAHQIKSREMTFAQIVRALTSTFPPFFFSPCAPAQNIKHAAMTIEATRGCVTLQGFSI
jgi:hypothetical protein